MKLNRNTAMGLFIAIILLGSTAGFALWSGSQGDSGPGPQPPPDDSTPTIIDYRAENVQADVVEIFSKVFLVANTKEAELSKILEELYEVENVLDVQAQYRSIEQTSFGEALGFFAELTIKRDSNPQLVIEDVKEKTTYLEEVEGGVYGLVALPQTVTLKNEELELETTHTFEDNLVQAMLSPETIKEDEIELTLRVSLSAEEILALMAFETKNITAEPNMVLFEEEMQIASLEPQLLLLGDYNYTNTTTEAELESLLQSAENISTVELNLETPEPTIYVDVNTDLNSLQQDINNALTPIEGITDFYFFTFYNSVSIGFDENTDYLSLKENILSALNSAGLTEEQLTLTEPRYSFRADLNTSTTDLNPTATMLLETLSEKEISAETYQFAKFNAPELTDPETNISYPNDMNFFVALVQPIHQENDTVDLEIFFYSVRGKATTISAAEKTEE